MNTPAHALLDLLALGRARARRAGNVAPVAAKSLLPDAPMPVFYPWQYLLGTPEHQIWRIAYRQQEGQLLLDSMSSVNRLHAFSGRNRLFCSNAKASWASLPPSAKNCPDKLWHAYLPEVKLCRILEKE